MVIDVFSKYEWIKPLKDKKGQTVADAFNGIFKSSKRIPDMIWTDKVNEFYNTHVKDLLKKITLNYIQQKMKKGLLLSDGLERLKIIIIMIF